MQLASEQAQSLEGATAAEERIQALEQRLASHQHATTAQKAAAAGEPPAMAAPGRCTPPPPLAPHCALRVGQIHIVFLEAEAASYEHEEVHLHHRAIFLHCCDAACWPRLL